MEFVENAVISTDDFWNDMMDGKIKPETLLKSLEDIKKVKEAIKLLNKFKDLAEDQEILNYF